MPLTSSEPSCGSRSVNSEGESYLRQIISDSRKILRPHGGPPLLLRSVAKQLLLRTDGQNYNAKPKNASDSHS